jgi:crotonobetainyl-CoA:carnitine CoA-transferase CaiB-like acyl-CoA transferase
MLVQAESGVIAVTGTPEDPAKVGISIGDISSGLYAYSSILAALIARSRTGLGQRIDISMLECLTEWMTPPLYVWRGAKKIPPRAGVRHNMIVPYGAYACRDGSVMFAIQSDREWRRFCEHVMPSIANDARFGTNPDRLQHREILEPLIEETFRALSVSDVSRLLEQAGIATGIVNDVPAVAEHPQLAARNRWVDVDSPCGTIPALIPPHNLKDSPPLMGRVPALGEHTDEILKELADA